MSTVPSPEPPAPAEPNAHESPATTALALRLRDARDDDALDVIELIAGVFGEYPGCITDVDGEMPELRALATHFAALGGGFRVAERDGRIVACCGWAPHGELVELKKLYVHRRERGSGLGAALVDEVETLARRRGARGVELWSDTRFTRAHRFYEKRGYRRGGTRELFDKSDTVEFHFQLELGGATDRPDH
jgi:putative acetyltransferase